MLTRISIGVLIALALDPVVDSIERRLPGRRGLAVAVVAVVVLGVAACSSPCSARGPSPRSRSSPSSSPRRSATSNGSRSSATGSATRISSTAPNDGSTSSRSSSPTSASASGRESLVSGVASVAIVAVVAISVLIDGENLLARFRRLLRPTRRAQADEVGRVVYRTLGRYVGGSLTVALMMGLYVLTIGLILGVPLAPLAAIWAMITDLIPQVGGSLGGAFSCPRG